MRICFLKGHGNCGGKISGEHYISETVLEAIGSNGDVHVGGFPWQEDQTLQSFGIRSLVVNALCETHNSGLSALDNVAGEFFRAVDAADKRPETLPIITSIDGTHIERWFLKVLCGLTVAAGFNNGTTPINWRKILSGGPWPAGWGLYVPAPSGRHVLATEFYIETLVNPESLDVKAAKFRVAGAHFSLLLGSPDNPTAWGKYRPRGLIFRSGNNERRIEFLWPFNTDEAVIYNRVGTSKQRVPQWEDWKE